MPQDTIDHIEEQVQEICIPGNRYFYFKKYAGGLTYYARPITYFNNDQKC